MGSVSAASVLGVGGGAGSLGQTGSQGQRRQGCRHTLVVIHPRNSLDIILKQLVFNCVHAASCVFFLLNLCEIALWFYVIQFFSSSEIMLTRSLFTSMSVLH